MHEAPHSSTSDFDPAYLAAGTDPSGHNALPAAGGVSSAHPPRGHRVLLRRNSVSAKKCLAAFILTFTVLLVAAQVTHLLRLWPAQPVATWAVLPPAGSDDYLAYSLGGIEDQMIYHGFLGIPKYLKRADVLFVGNSHMQFGWPRQTLEPFFAARHMHFYNMAFGYVETSAFPLAIIKKYNLHPKWIIINVEPFFSNKPSGMAEVTMDDTMFDAFKFRLETAGSFYGDRYLHRVVPTLAQQFPPGDEVYFRSIHDGSVWLAAAADIHWHPTPVTTPWRACIPAALKFKAAMDRRNIRMIFTHSPVTTDTAARGLSVALGGVPVVDASSLPNLYTFDGSHLEHASAVRFSQSFLNHLAPVIDGVK